MRRPLRAWLVPFFAASALAGCFGGDVPPPAATDAAPATLPEPPLVAPNVSARETLDALRTFTEAHPYRQAGNPLHLAARDWLERELKSAGLETLRQPFPSLDTEGQNILGVKWGKDRTNWIVVGAHYDVTQLALYGAYDDGSGTLLTLKLAQAFARTEPDRTLAFILFDQEERGLIGSTFFVDQVTKGTFAHPIEVVAMVDLDMIGITWPHPAKLVCWENSDEVKAAVETARKAVGVPDANVAYRMPVSGRSDGAAFMAAGIPTTYCWSDWDEVVLADGTPYAGSYPWWHKADTYETMRLMAGDEATLEAGFQTVLDVFGPVVATLSDDVFEADVRG